MKKMRIYKHLILLSVTLSLSVLAGETGTHGGNVVVCSGKDAVVLDYYNATLKTFGGASPDLISIGTMGENEVITTIEQKIAAQGYHHFLADLDTALLKIGEISTWTESSLKQVDDSWEPYTLPTSCTRKTAAIRTQTPDLLMYGDPTIMSLLSPGQRGVLRLHEALYLMSENKAFGSAPVRNAMKTFLQKNVSDYGDAIYTIGHKADWRITSGYVATPYDLPLGKYHAKNFSNDSTGNSITVINVNQKESTITIEHHASADNSGYYHSAYANFEGTATFKCYERYAPEPRPYHWLELCISDTIFQGNPLVMILDNLGPELEIFSSPVHTHDGTVSIEYPGVEGYTP